jgi:hypothetical protein
LKISCYCLFNISFRKYLPAFCLRLTECWLFKTSDLTQSLIFILS